MKLFELEEKEIQDAYYDPEDDKINTRIPSDTRKPVITLKSLNRLKKIRALRRLEKLRKEDLLQVMYGGGDGDEGGFGGPPSF